MRPYELCSERVLLAVPSSDEIDRVTGFCQDTEIQRWTTMPSPYHREHAERFIAQQVPGGWDTGSELTWAVRNPSDRTLLGMVSVHPDGTGSGEIGFWMSAPARRRGLTTEAARLVVDNAFDRDGLALARLTWRALVGNWPSRRVAWKLGFSFHGVVRAELVKNGVRRDAWLATLLAGDLREPAHRWFDAPTLRADGVVLRRWRDSDADAVVDACTDRVTRQWLGGLPDPYTRETALEYIASREEAHASARGIHWAAAADDHGPALGSFSLMASGERPIGDFAEVGYWVAPQARGRGVATAGVRAMVAHAFAPGSDDGLGLRRLLLAHARGNDASRAVALHAGFSPFGVERAAERLGDGTYADLHWYDLLAPSG